VWPAAANLAALIARSPELVRGLRVCELGSGLGVAGLSAAKAGATTVTLVDREALALHCAMSTAEVCTVCGRTHRTVQRLHSAATACAACG
jgi:predicted nicotinamide N-methyase